MRVIFAGGGSGGHLFPAQAIADEIRKKNPESKILFVGAKRGLDSTLVPKMGYDLKLLPVYPLKGQNPLNIIRSIAMILVSVLISFYILLKFRPQVIIGVGGYASGPFFLAAWILKLFSGYKLALLEINSIPGMTNKILSKMSDIIFLSSPSTLKYFNETRCRLLGIPIRENVVRRFNECKDQKRNTRNISIIGGSQGGMGMNTLIVEALRKSEKIKSGIKNGKFKITHQCGKKDYERLEGIYSDLELLASENLNLMEFVSDVGALYANTDLLICRAGAGTLSEILLFKIPSILIPLPTAADNHQEINARELESRAEAIVIIESEENISKLSLLMEQFLDDPSKSEAITQALRANSVKNASETIVEALGLP